MKNPIDQNRRLASALILSLASLLPGATHSVAHDSEAGEDVRLVLEERLTNTPGQSLSAVTVHYQPGGKSSEHQHAGSVFAYVLEGAIKSENSATGPGRIYQAGDSFFEPPGSRHLVCENASTTAPASLLAVFVAQTGASLTTIAGPAGEKPTNAALARRIFETMLKVPGNQSGHRTVHAKGLVCEGTFLPSREAKTLSRAAHFRGAAVPITVRFSDGSPDPYIPDGSPDAGPRGMAIRFRPAAGGESDLVLMSHNGFVVGSGEEFLALQESIVATDPTQPHPWPVEGFLASHPLAMKFVQDNRKVPSSFSTEGFFSNDAFLFVDDKGTRQAGRYKVIPVRGVLHLSEAEASTLAPQHLMEELSRHLAAQPVEYRLVVQLPNPGDSTRDPSAVWPQDRRVVALGMVRITKVAENQAATQQALAFDPTHLIDGIELSDDPLPSLRSRVYALAASHRKPSVVLGASESVGESRPRTP